MACQADVKDSPSGVDDRTKLPCSEGKMISQSQDDVRATFHGPCLIEEGMPICIADPAQHYFPTFRKVLEKSTAIKAVKACYKSGLQRCADALLHRDAQPRAP